LEKRDPRPADILALRGLFFRQDEGLEPVKRHEKACGIGELAFDPCLVGAPVARAVERVVGENVGVLGAAHSGIPDGFLRIHADLDGVRLAQRQAALNGRAARRAAAAAAWPGAGSPALQVLAGSRLTGLASGVDSPDIVPSGGWRRTGPSPLRSGPEGSSRNEFGSGCPSSLPPFLEGRFMDDSEENPAPIAEEPHRPDPADEPGLALLGGEARPPARAQAAGYQVLARKYRPTTFDDLVGQEAMVRTLSNAFETGRIAHAFMLTGVRGVGKTTTA